jgi:hypothetical protein
MPASLRERPLCVPDRADLVRGGDAGLLDGRKEAPDHAGQELRSDRIVRSQVRGETERPNVLQSGGAEDPSPGACT